MLIAKVTGNVISTHKLDCYHGHKLLVVRPIDLSGNFSGDEVIAVDGADSHAGVGDIVLLMAEGGSARIIARQEGMLPIDTSIAGIVDSVISSHGEIHQSE